MARKMVGCPRCFSQYPERKSLRRYWTCSALGLVAALGWPDYRCTRYRKGVVFALPLVRYLSRLKLYAIDSR